jgi:hypothetical protein
MKRFAEYEGWKIDASRISQVKQGIFSGGRGDRAR